MQDVIELRRPDPSLHREWLDFLAGFDSDDIPGSSSDADQLRTTADPEVFVAWVRQMLARERGEELPADRVTCSSRWIVEDGGIVGTVNLRQHLSDYLLHVEGGHIGYAVAPHARRRGVATEAVRLMVAEAAELGINPLLLTCDADNLASARTIERAGGVLEQVRDGRRRYWIHLPDTPIGYAAQPLGARPLLGLLVTLRLATTAEVAAMHAAGVAGNADPTARLADWVDGFPRRDDLDGAPLRDVDAVPDRQWATRLVVRRSDDRVVGTLGFFGPPAADGVVEIGYGLVESARGQGLITDALRLVVPAAEVSGATVQAHAAYDNVASRRALVAAGFRETGRINADGEAHYLRERR